MEKKIFEEKLEQLSRKYEQTNEYSYLESIEKEFQDYLKYNPKDSESWITFAIFLYEDLHTTEEAVKCLEELLINDSENIRALLVLAMIQDFSYGSFDEKVFDQISATRIKNYELLSMVEYMKAWGYYFNNKEQREKCLINSINLYPNHVKNNEELGKIYLGQGKIEEGCTLIKKALRNVKFIFPELWLYICPTFKITSVDKYLAEFITGTSMSSSNFKELGELYLKCCPSSASK